MGLGMRMLQAIPAHLYGIPLLSAFPSHCHCNHTVLEAVVSSSPLLRPWLSPAPRFLPLHKCMARPRTLLPRLRPQAQRYRLVPAMSSMTQPRTAINI